jgi:hydrogenase nickel incorporation protein HypA/HybF
VHELSIVEALIEQVQREVEEANHGGRVVGVDLVVGRLCGAHADSIRFAFEMLAPGTLVEAATLRIAEPKAVCRCHACGNSTEVEDMTVVCVVCSSADVSIEGGRDLLLESIELDEV